MKSILSKGLSGVIAALALITLGWWVRGVKLDKDNLAIKERAAKIEAQQIIENNRLKQVYEQAISDASVNASRLQQQISKLKERGNNTTSAGGAFAATAQTEQYFALASRAAEIASTCDKEREQLRGLIDYYTANVEPFTQQQ